MNTIESEKAMDDLFNMAFQLNAVIVEQLEAEHPEIYKKLRLKALNIISEL